MMVGELIESFAAILRLEDGKAVGGEVGFDQFTVGFEIVDTSRNE